MDTRRKNNKAQVSKNISKIEGHESNNISSAEIDINSITSHNLKIESKLKGIIENFINQEIKNTFNLLNYSNKKIKNHYEFDLKINSEEECDTIISLFFNHSEFRDKKEIKVFKDKIEIHPKESSTDAYSKKVENKSKISEETPNINNKKANNEAILPNYIKSELLLSNQITMENVPESLDKEKLFEIFFIYGDILEIVLKKEEKKACISFKFGSSVDKALRKFFKSQKNFKSFTIRKSLAYEKIEEENLKLKILKESDKHQHLQLNYSPEVIYIKFIDGSIIDVEEIKRMLKKYGEVQVISRKIEGRSYFILFKEENVGAKVVKDFKKGLFSIKNIEAHNLIVDFACNKTEIENKHEAAQEKENKTRENKNETIKHETQAYDSKSDNKQQNEALIEQQQTNQTHIILADHNLKSINNTNTNNTNHNNDNIIINNDTNNNDKINNATNTSNINAAAEHEQQQPQTQFESLDINKYWQTYFDPTYNRNYYYNPFLNESVWELPAGAWAQDLNSQLQQSQEDNTAQTEINITNNQNKANNDQQSNINNTNIKSQNQNANHFYECADENQSQGSYYDEEAWEEDELREKIIWDKLKQEQLKDWMKRAARKQVADTRRDTAYIEGNYDYNIWYDKYLTDRKEEKEKIPAMHICNPALDTGFTKADLQEKEGGAFFCLYFAKGCCSEGVNCRYYHRVPTKNEADKIENLRDVFGRSRFATHRSDMGGVGTFTRDCRTLYVSDLKMVDSANPIKDMIRIIYDNFSPWGEIEDINYIPTKAACFIRFSHRCFAEFAKEAMMDQSLVGEEILGVKWAFDDPNPMMKKKIEKEHENRFLSAHLKRDENRNEMLRKKRNNPNSDYFSYYNNRNNPYAGNAGNNSNNSLAGNPNAAGKVGFGYESGYGYDDCVGSAAGFGYPAATGAFSSYSSDDYKHQQITNNCVKLSETLKMIDENFNNFQNN